MSSIFYLYIIILSDNNLKLYALYNILGMCGDDIHIFCEYESKYRVLIHWYINQKCINIREYRYFLTCLLDIRYRPISQIFRLKWYHIIGALGIFCYAKPYFHV